MTVTRTVTYHCDSHGDRPGPARRGRRRDLAITRTAGGPGKPRRISLPVHHNSASQNPAGLDVNIMRLRLTDTPGPGRRRRPGRPGRRIRVISHGHMITAVPGRKPAKRGVARARRASAAFARIQWGAGPRARTVTVTSQAPRPSSPSHGHGPQWHHGSMAPPAARAQVIPERARVSLSCVVAVPRAPGRAWRDHRGRIRGSRSHESVPGGPGRLHRPHLSAGPLRARAARPLPRTRNHRTMPLRFNIVSDGRSRSVPFSVANLAGPGRARGSAGAPAPRQL